MVDDDAPSPEALFAGIAHGGLAAHGRRLTPAIVQATAALLAPSHRLGGGATVQRDVAYGQEPRQRLDIYRPRRLEGASAIIVFVHGGGFVAGDKSMAGTPFYGNVGAWAAAAGHVGVVMTYRLAPRATWPSGGEDVIAAVTFVKSLHRSRGADRTVVVVGQSAGAAHLATAIALLRKRRTADIFDGAVMMSGIYNPALLPDSSLRSAYYGNDKAAYGLKSTLREVAATDLPCLFTVSEFDPLEFQEQALAMVRESIARRGRWPQMLTLMGHNHVSPAMSIGADGDHLGELLLRFVSRCPPRRAEQIRFRGDVAS